MMILIFNYRLESWCHTNISNNWQLIIDKCYLYQNRVPLFTYFNLLQIAGVIGLRKPERHYPHHRLSSEKAIKESQANYRYLAEIVIYSIGQQGKLLSLAANNLWMYVRSFCLIMCILRAVNRRNRDTASKKQEKSSNWHRCHVNAACISGRRRRTFWKWCS